MNSLNKDNTNDRIKNRIQERRREKESRKHPEPVRMQTFNTYSQDAEHYIEAGKRYNRTFNARWVSGILTLIFGIMTACYAFLPQFRFNEINITGMKKISKDEIIYFSGAMGEPIFTVDPAGIRSTLLRHYHDVYDAEVTIGFPAEMTIDLKERVPVVEWDFGGSRFWIDKEGTVLNESNSQETTIHVYADSFPGANDQEDRNIPLYFSKDVLHTIETMGKNVPADKPLYFTYKNGFGWDTNDGWRIFFGKTDTDMDEKLRMEQSLTAYFHENEIQPVFVSLEFKDAPYYRFVER